MWHVSHEDKNFGPFSEEKMLALIKAGKLPPTVYVWKQGTADWVMLSDSSLMQATPSSAAVAPPAAANPFDFSKPATRNQPPGAAINVVVSPQPTAQQLANPYFSDFKGSSAGAQPAGVAANPNFRLLPLQGRQTVVIATTAIAGVMSLACAWFTFQQVSLMKKIVSGAYRNNINRILADAKASDDQFFIVFLVLLVAVLVMSIAFAVWFYRAHVNAQAMSQAKFTDTSGWAVGFLFIPIMNLFKPYVGMRDIWRGSFSAPGSFAAPPPTIVGAWWTACIAMNFLNRFTIFAFKPQNPAPDDMIALSNIAMIGNMLMLVPLVLTVIVVTKITKQQTRKAQQISQGITQPQQKQPQPGIQLPQF